MRVVLMWVVPLAAVGLATSALGGVNEPVPGSQSCPGGAAWEWVYDLDGGIPDNAQIVPGSCNTPDGRCYRVPIKACLQVVEVDSRVYNVDIPPPPPKPIDPPPGPNPAPPNTSPQPPIPRPIGAKGHVPPPLPENGDCRAGTGYDFEDFYDNLPDPTNPSGVQVRGYADFQGWTGGGTPQVSPFVSFENADLAMRAAPVYGNAVEISRIRPPGWSADIENQVGGDYWKFSQDVNQHGDFWVSSLDRRYSWRQQPGEWRDSWGEMAVGTLTSKPCTLRSRYLTFKLGGSNSSTQRVELQVLGGDPRQYFGVRFWGGPGDPSVNGARGYSTQYGNQPALAQEFPPPNGSDGWVAVRSSMPEDPGAERDWMQTNVWDLAPFVGQKIQIRLVDDHRGECTVHFRKWCLGFATEHVEVDDFRFTDDLPTGTVWRRHSDGQCGGVPGAGDGCSPVGRVPEEPPLWGTTDVHAHPMSNVTFGGHVFWGDAADPLERVYDCSDGAQKSTCYLRGELVALVSATLFAGCQALTLIPFIGGAAAAVCDVAVAAADAVARNVPIISGARLHGAGKMTSGAIKVGLMFSDAILSLFPDLTLDFEVGLLPSVDSMNSATGSEADGWWKAGESYHNATGLNKTHNMYQADMIKRAWSGGMRLGVWDVAHSRAFAMLADGTAVSSDWQALKDGTDAAKRVVSTALAGVAEIAYAPADVDRIVRANKLAVILGSEVDELGRLREPGLPWPRSPRVDGDSMQKQVDDLWELGIRKITPVHSSNNPIGGAALFTTNYDSNNYYLNGTPADRGPRWEELPVARFILDGAFGPLLGGLILGDFQLLHVPAQPTHAPWNPYDWFDFDQRRTVSESVIGGYDQITYRIGMDGVKSNTLRASNGWKPPSDVLGTQVLNLAVMEAGALAFSPGGCDIEGTAIPTHVTSFGPDVDAHYVNVDGHRNALGLYRAQGGNDGEAFLRAAMKKGMLIDLDHLSQNMRLDVYKLAAGYAAEAGWKGGDYPLVSVHSKVRGLEKDHSSLEEFRNNYGTNDEASRTEAEIARVAANQGTIAVFPTGSAFIPPNTKRCRRDNECASYVGPGAGVCNLPAGKDVGTCDLPAAIGDRDYDLPSEVQNDCDESSKTYALKYLYLMRLMKGHGLTPATDLNGLASTLKPRFGQSMPWMRPCSSGGERGDTDVARTLASNGKPQWGAIMQDAQRYEFSGVWYDDYGKRTPTPSALPSSWPADSRFKEVVARRSDEQREDRAPRAKAADVVYFNDHGADNQPHDGYKYQLGNRPGAQMYAMKKWQMLQGLAGWDYNLDGLQHIGLFPDLLQDMRNVGVQWEQLGPIMHATQDYLDTWKRAVSIGVAHP